MLRISTPLNKNPLRISAPPKKFKNLISVWALIRSITVIIFIFEIDSHNHNFRHLIPIKQKVIIGKF